MQILNRDLEQRLFALRRGRQGMKRRQTQSHPPNLSRFLHLLLSLFAVFCVGANRLMAADAASCHSLSDHRRALFDRWNAALATGDPAQVSALYQADALLLPTLSDQARTSTAGRRIIKGFLSQHPNGRIDQRVIQSDLQCRHRCWQLQL